MVIFIMDSNFNLNQNCYLTSILFYRVATLEIMTLFFDDIDANNSQSTYAWYTVRPICKSFSHADKNF